MYKEKQISKAIVSYFKQERSAVIERRLKKKKGGLGYLAALDAREKVRINKIKEDIERAKV